MHSPEFVLLAGALIASCGGPAPGGAAEDLTDVARAGGRTLELRSQAGGCTLRVRGGGAARDLQLTPKAPCYFLRSAPGAPPQAYRYEDVRIDAVLIVSGTPASAATRKVWALAPEWVCGEETQGVLLRAGEVLVTSAIGRGGVSCRDHGVDEKNYWAFAHGGG